MVQSTPCIAVRGSTGLCLSQGPPTYETIPSFKKDESKTCRAMQFSPEGSYFAWSDEILVKIALCSTWKVIATINRAKVLSVQFSPKGTYLTTMENFVSTPANPGGNSNLHIWKSADGTLMKSFVQKYQIDWILQWSNDEKLCGMLINNDVVLYENGNFENKVHRINVAKIGKFRFSPGVDPYHIFCYLPGSSGQPSLGKLFQYPKFEMNQSIANKTFFQTDQIDIYWNKTGTDVLLMTSTDVDKTGSSYYGKQSLHHVNIKGDTALVVLGKEGPIYKVQWSPKNTEFCVAYGFMPSKTTLFNSKCEVIFEFGEVPRNSIYYNPYGNIVLLGGFGGLRGNIELWDVEKKKIIGKTESPDTTLLEWSPNGEHFMTATTSPRLRVGNGFRIWHYSGSLLYERPWNKQEALWEVLWQTYPPGTFKKPQISYKAVEGITSSQPIASKEVYRPPSLRGRLTNSKTNDDENSKTKTTNTDSSLSKNAMKKKKYRETKKAKKELEPSVQNAKSIDDHSKINPKNEDSQLDLELTDDPEKNKKIKKVKSKLDQISKLKVQLSSGKQLEINQLDKIEKEAELLKELQELTL